MDFPVDVGMALGALEAGDRAAHGAAYATLQSATAGVVDWGPTAWDRLVALLGDKDNHVRAIAGQALCWLAVSVPVEVVQRDLEAIFAVTRDERFVTARHVLLALWQVGLAAELRDAVIDRLAVRYRDCGGEKNASLIRYDILCGLRRLFDATGAARAREVSLQLIPEETDLKYRKKYLTAWRGV